MQDQIDYMRISAAQSLDLAVAKSCRGEQVGQ